MMRSARMLVLAASLAAVSSIASGYAHWVFYAGRSAPFNGVPALFNLGSLTNNTVSYFISDQTPGGLMPGDSVASVISQIQGAAAVWNTVSSSNIRVAFGGYAAIGQPQTAPQSTPGIDVVFDDDDVPPGLAAITHLTWLESDMNAVANGAGFVPIRRSTISLRHNLSSVYPLASYDDVLFMIVTHEFGHALGLQHTLTSGLMATTYTSATTKAAPLSPDDIAGISLLYPAPGYQQSTGSISGVVLVGGQGVNMANVVALSTNGTAISTLSNPDGTYSLQGVPPGQYYVYAGPLPPTQTGEATPDNIVPPVDAQGNPFNAQTGFDTEFAPGTRDLAQATVATVTAGNVTGGINCNLQSRSTRTFNYIETWGYVGQIAVASPPLLAGSRQYLVFGGPAGVTGSSGLASGLSVSAIGAASVETKTLAYNSPGFAEIVVDPGQVQSAAAVALVLTAPNDMYVLPYAFSVVPTPPPSITGITTANVDASGNTTVTLQGANLTASTNVVFDGAPAPVISANSDGSLTVAAPPASAGYTAYVEALSTQGQTSWQDLGTGPRPSFTYAAPQSPSFVINYAQLLPGATSLLDIIGTPTALFQSAPCAIGMGSSDISVGQIWVLSYSPPRMLANVSVSSQAQPGPVDVTVTCGLQTMTLPAALQVQAANPNQMTLLAPVLNQATGLAGTPAGGAALVSSAGLPQNLTGWPVAIDYSFPTTAQMQVGNQVLIPVPTGVPSGPAIVQLTPPNPSLIIPAVVMQVDTPDPVIQASVSASANAVSAANPVHIGDTVTLTVSGLTQSATGAGLANTLVYVGGISGGAVITPSSVTSLSQPDTYQIQFTLSPNAPFGPGEPVQVGIGTRVSAPVSLFILPALQ